MEYVTYERPREKMRHHGATTLTIAELLQLIIGSGGPGVGGARIARSVDSLLLQGRVTYQKLVEIQGVGDAKACQLLAVLELSRRGVRSE